MKKRVIATLLCMAMGLSLVACGSTETKTDAPAESKTEDTKEEAKEDTKEEAKEEVKEEAPAEDQEIHLNVTNGEVRKFDPQLCGGAKDYQFHSNLCEGLFKYESDGVQAGTNPNVTGSEIVLGQAESYEYDEATMTYTFHLRDDIYWSDGVEVTAQHFVDAWHRLANPENAASQIQMFVGIVKNARAVFEGELPYEEIGVKAVDDKTLTIEMEAECGYFTQLLAHYAVQPLRQDEVDKYSAEEYGYHTPYITNGPFYINELVRDVSATMVPNEYYYDRDKIQVDSVTWHVCNNEATMLAAYQSGEWDYINSIPADQIAVLEASGDLWRAPYLALNYMYCNMLVTPDWRVRAAYSLAIDRDNIADNIVRNGSLASTGLIPQGITNSQGVEWMDYAGDIMWKWLSEQYPDADLTTYPGRVELAQQLYNEAVADGAADPAAAFPYRYGKTEQNTMVAEAMQIDINSALGCNMVLEPVDAIFWDEEYALGRLTYTGKYNDPTTYFNCYGSQGQYENAYYKQEYGYAAEYDALLKEIKSMPGGVERDEKMLELEELMFSDKGFSIVPLHGGASTYCMDPELKGIYISPISSQVFYKYAHY